MSHPLHQRLLALRRRVRFTTAVYSLSIVAAAVLATTMALGTIDYLLRIEDRGLRIIASLVLCGVAVGVLYRQVVTVLFKPLRNADLAHRVEGRFPQLNDGLSSAVDFLARADNDAMAGSPALRRAVVERITAETARLHFAHIVRPWPAIAAILLLAATGTIAVNLVMLSPSTAGTAVTRLINPLSNAHWPRANHLAIRRSQLQLARGQTFQVEIVDSRQVPLPSDIRIRYRADQMESGAPEETQPMTVTQDVAVARRDNVQRPFSFRIEGGDDHSLPWIDVAVADPPAIASLSIEVAPPSYTGWPTTRAQRHIRALVGSNVRITAEATKPLRSAAIALEPAEKIPAQLDRDGIGFTAHFRVERSGYYWVDLVDRDGFAAGGGDDRWEISALPDGPPTVSLDRPPANLVVTPQATVPLQVTAKDDVRVSQMMILFKRGDSESETTLPLWNRHGLQHVRAEDGDSRTVEHRLGLGPLGLAAPTRVVLRAAATDGFHQRAESEPRTLMVVSPAELRNHIAAREKIIRDALQRAATIERDCRRHVEGLRNNLMRPAQIRPPDVDSLRTAQHNQAEVEQALTSRQHGVPLHVLSLLDDLDNNHIDGETRQRLASLLDDIDRIERRHLPLVGRELLSAVKTGQLAVERQDRAGRLQADVVAALAAAAGQQKQVIASLDHILGQWAKSDNYRGLTSELARLLQQQTNVAERTAEVGRRTLAQDLRDLAPRELSELKSAAERQLEVARRFDRWLQEIEQAAADPAQRDAAGAAKLAGGANLAHRHAVGASMRTVGQQIEANHIGQAASGQKQIAMDLHEMLAALTAGQGRVGEQTAQSPASDTEAALPKTSDAQSLPVSTVPRPETSPKQPAGGDTAGSAPGVPGQSKARQPAVEQHRSMISRLWGQLPPHARQQVVQPPVEEFPPKYEAQIEDYFRRLAEEK